MVSSSGGTCSTSSSCTNPAAHQCKVVDRLLLFRESIVKTPVQSLEKGHQRERERKEMKYFSMENFFLQKTVKKKYKK